MRDHNKGYPTCSCGGKSYHSHYYYTHQSLSQDPQLNIKNNNKTEVKETRD